MLELIVYSVLLSSLVLYLFAEQERTYNESPLAEATSPVEEEVPVYPDDYYLPAEEEVDLSEQVEVWNAETEAEEAIRYLAEELEASHTIRELKALASKAGVKGYGNMTKRELACEIASL